MTSFPSSHRYPVSALTAEGAGGLIVFLAMTGLCALYEAASLLSLLFLSGALAAAFYLGTVGLRAFTVLVLTPEGLEQRLSGPFAQWLNVRFGAKIRWTNLNVLQLNYYSTRQDKTNGWFDLTLGASGRKIRVLESISGFDQILAAAHRAALKNHVTLGPTTRTNLNAFKNHMAHPGRASRTERRTSR